MFNWYYTSSPTQWVSCIDYWDCLYKLMHIHVCMHVISDPIILCNRNCILKFFILLGKKKKITDGSYCVIRTEQEKKSREKKKIWQYLGNQSFPHCNNSLEWREFLGIGEKTVSLPKSFDDKGHGLWYNPKHKRSITSETWKKIHLFNNLISFYLPFPQWWSCILWQYKHFTLHNIRPAIEECN